LNMPLDFNDAGPQKSFEVIPAGTICTLQMTVRPGGAGEDGWLKRSADGASEALDCEFTVVSPEPFAKRKVWQLLTLRGTTPGHKEAGEISSKFLAAVLESARGIKPGDKSENARTERQVANWGEFNGLRFVARIGVRPPRDGYEAKNTITEVITPERKDWVQIEQPPPDPTAPTPSAQAPAPQATSGQEIAKPAWAK
jgi:hypothetical protein